MSAFGSASTILADMDFETYSTAGYVYDSHYKKWEPIAGSGSSRGLFAVGASVYTEHPSAEVISLAYDLKDGLGRRLWVPQLPHGPVDLFEHIAAGGIIEAHNVMFELLVWANICVPKYGWPQLPVHQLRCSQAKCQAFGLPGALANISKVLNLGDKGKMESGKNLITKFTKGRKPTKGNPSNRLRLCDSPKEGAEFLKYNIFDIISEGTASSMVPDLDPFEMQVWQMDLRMNYRGCQIDMDSVRNLKFLVDYYTPLYNNRIAEATGGEVASAKSTSAMAKWVTEQGYSVSSVDQESMSVALKDPECPAQVKSVLSDRAMVSGAAVSKLKALTDRTSADGRMRDMFSYCGAGRTRRWAGRGPQPQNLPNSGPEVRRCGCCFSYASAGIATCPNCGKPLDGENLEWNFDAASFAIQLSEKRDPQYFSKFFPNPIEAISGCLRPMFVAGPGKNLICADFSAIEAVVLAFLAGEQWRMDVFNTHGKIYEMSASKITGIPFEDFLAHKERTGEHHPLRKKIGKVAELASGYQGWIGAWKAFGADKFFEDDEEIKEKVLNWREASPMVVALWNGTEECFKNALKYPGKTFSYRQMSYMYAHNVLFCRVPSGGLMAYHNPRIEFKERFGRLREVIRYDGWNSDTTKGPRGWITMETYGGKLTENLCQRVARDIQAHSLVNLDAAGYLPVLQVHDEIISEVPEDWGSVEEFEKIMGTMPDWCKEWPVRASGGWIGKRYRKD